MFFDDVVVGADCLLGVEGEGWKQVTSELSLERSGPERYLSSFALFVELVRLAGRVDSEALRHAIGRLTAELWTLRQMSLSVAGQLAAGEDPMLAAAIVKDLGNTFEQSLPPLVQSLVGRETSGSKTTAISHEHSRCCCRPRPRSACAAARARFSAASSPADSDCADMSEQRQLLADSAARLFETNARLGRDRSSRDCGHPRPRRARRQRRRLGRRVRSAASCRSLAGSVAARRSNDCAETAGRGGAGSATVAAQHRAEPGRDALARGTRGGNSRARWRACRGVAMWLAS